MSSVTIAAVQAASVLMNQEATLAKAVELIAKAAARGSRIMVFPEVFIPDTPVWVYNQTIWERDDAWYAMLVDQAVTVPGPVTDGLGAAAKDAGVYLVMGVDEREPHGATIYNTILYFGGEGSLLGKHRKLVSTGLEHGVRYGRWVHTAGHRHPIRTAGRTDLLGELHAAGSVLLYASGVDIWVAPTLDATDSWVTTMQHIALEGRCYVVGVNPCVHIDQIPADFPDRDRVWRPHEDNDQWVEEGNSSSSVQPEPPDSPGEAPGNHPQRPDRAFCSARRTPVLRPGRPLPPTRHLPAQRRHSATPSRPHSVS